MGRKDADIEHSSKPRQKPTPKQKATRSIVVLLFWVLSTMVCSLALYAFANPLLGWSFWFCLVAGGLFSVWFCSLFFH